MSQPQRAQHSAVSWRLHFVFASQIGFLCLLTYSLCPEYDELLCYMRSVTANLPQGWFLCGRELGRERCGEREIERETVRERESTKERCRCDLLLRLANGQSLPLFPPFFLSLSIYLPLSLVTDKPLYGWLD